MLDEVERIPYKILRFCRRCLGLEMEISTCLNGFHIKLYGCGECDLCRLVFDDQSRYTWDLNTRPESERNVFWSRKTIIKKGFKPIVFEK